MGHRVLAAMAALPLLVTLSCDRGAPPATREPTPIPATAAQVAPEASAPELITVVTGNEGEVLLEWSIDPAPAGLTGWQYRQQKLGYEDPIEPKAGSWGAWTNVPGATAATRSYLLTGLPNAVHFFEVRAVAGSRTGRASTSVYDYPAIVGGDGIPRMSTGQIIEGGRTWRLGAGLTVVDVPAGTRLEFQGGALADGRVVVSFRDVASGAVQVVAIDQAEGVWRYPPDAPQADAPTGGARATARDVDAILDKIMASARLVPVR